MSTVPSPVYTTGDSIFTLTADGDLMVSTRLGEEQEMMVYGRAVAAGMCTIDELVNFLKEQFRDAETWGSSA